ncbi:uncharacterized protein A1O9_12885 [Exophiala aquamarina CBS 119918]|uniref:Uncharacterized protein n=1 Tax=Exophiala aquamarina CBS 119918 TaxID=1182545 RepID=A0A072NT61_9EURO|nr:uncharacterized protein A1O9_12885 [Exophiala aquamarina CBS 119918]KEF51069.1 hypothetical protein A1O9_12885 [Exophiala aquamarina CBS 119918]
MQPYAKSSPVDVNATVQHSVLNGKTAIVTGGANGIGEAYSRALIEAGAFVIVADLDEVAGANMEKQFYGRTKFVRCNVTNWNAQLVLFQKSIAESPSGMIDIVIPNAGIDGADSVFYTDVTKEPEKPSLNILDVNLTGALYTIKLALHHFRKQHAEASAGVSVRNHDLIIQGSLAGYLDLPGALEYSASKFAMRGIMRDLRRTEWQHNIRVNFIGPWFVRTNILNNAVLQHLENSGVEFATVNDTAAAMMRILCNSSIIGRSMAIVPRSVASCGYVSLDADDFDEGSILRQLQDWVEVVDNRSKVSA